jgi:tight adherence protein B
MADSLQAGLSFSQAVEFVIPNIPDPGSWEMSKLAGQIKLGLSIKQALKDLYCRRPIDDVRILVEGVILQQQVGGNMAMMMREIAAMIRTRVELKNEIRTQTAQGRLSAVVIAMLLPVSLGLLSFFPGYTDVLFQTTIGNWILITAGLLEVIGGILIMRLIRIEV